MSMMTPYRLGIFPRKQFSAATRDLLKPLFSWLKRCGQKKIASRIADRNFWVRYCTAQEFFPEKFHVYQHPYTIREMICSKAPVCFYLQSRLLPLVLFPTLEPRGDKSSFSV